jgi:TonB family protein
VSAEKEDVLYRVRSMVEDISSFQSPIIKAAGLTRIADIVWAQDEQYTRGLFDRALSLTGGGGGDAKIAKAQSYLRREIIARIARHDAEWAKRLIDETATDEDEKQGAAERGELGIETAKRLYEEDPKLATEFASRSLQGGVSPELVWFLKSLRQRDEASADRLFLSALDQFAHQPSFNAEAFAMFGTYIFTSPRLDGGDTTSVMLTRVGDVGMIDITADRPGVRPSLIPAYLRTAAGLLRQPTADPQQRKLNYALAYLLMPKALKFAPGLAAQLGASLADLSTGVPPAMTHEAAFANINKKTVDSPEQVMSNAERLPDSESRDIAYLDVASRAWLKKDFATAQVACAKIENKDARSQLGSLIEFGKASAQIESNSRQLSEATALAERLPQGVERAVLYFGISEAAFKGQNHVLANEAAAQGRKAALSVTDPRQPHLLLLAAKQFARHDVVAAESAFNEGLKGFNALDGEALAGVSWNQKVQVAELVVDFPLAVPGLDFSFNKSFRSVLSFAGFDGGISRARELKSEQLRMSAFTALADELLKTLPEEKTLPEGEQSGETVVRVGEDGMRKSAEKTVMPAYSEDALKKAQQGVAVVETLYNGKGVVTDASVLESPSPGIGQAVVEAVRQWKFKPSTLNGEPISVRGKLTFYFVIGKDGRGRVENPKQFQ